MPIKHRNELLMANAIMHGDRKKQADLLTHDNPNISLHAIQAVLSSSSDPLLRAHFRRRERCSPNARCYSKGCPKCVLTARDQNRQVNQAKSKSLSKDPQVRMAQRASIFHSVPESEVWFVTINLEAVHIDAVQHRIKHWRQIIRRHLKKVEEQFGLLWVHGRFEDDPFIARNLRAGDFSDPATLLSSSPDEILMKLHLHALVHIPNAGHGEIRDSLVREFGPERIVNVRSIRHASDHNCIDQHGIDGAARYMTKEHIKLSGLKNAKLDVIHDAMKSLLCRERKSTGFQFGIRCLANSQIRQDGKLMKRWREQYHLPVDWDRNQMELYMIDEDLSEVVHGCPSSFDAYEDMRYDSINDNPFADVVHARKLVVSKIASNLGVTSS